MPGKPVPPQPDSPNQHPHKPVGGQPPAVQGKVERPAAPMPPVFVRPPVPPRQMVTAQERLELREKRRSQKPPAVLPPLVVNITAASPADQAAWQAEVERFNDLQNRLMLTEINDDLEDIESAITALPANLENVRARGYVFKNYLEKKIETLSAQWKDLRPRVTVEIAERGRQLREDAQAVQNILRRGQSAAAALSTLETQAEAVTRNLRGMYNTLDTNVTQTQRQIDDISWTLQQAEQASFGFLATEAPVEAVPANWKNGPDKDGLDGVLFLTDQRIIFEQKEEVVTKKVLFVATEKQKVQKLQWAVPLAEVEQAVGSKKGFMAKDDYLTLTCVSGAAPMRTLEIHLKGESGEAWQGFIGRVKSGEMAKERTVPIDQAALEAVANAPTKCAHCGATLTQTILRGQSEITCEFCGSKIRL